MIHPAMVKKTFIRGREKKILESSAGTHMQGVTCFW